jgi:hypothetical protein
MGTPKLSRSYFVRTPTNIHYPGCHGHNGFPRSYSDGAANSRRIRNRLARSGGQMSEWYDADDIELDFKRKEVDVFVKQDDFGSVYVTLTFEQIKELHNKIQEKQSGKQNNESR